MLKIGESLKCLEQRRDAIGLKPDDWVWYLYMECKFHEWTTLAWSFNAKRAENKWEYRELRGERSLVLYYFIVYMY